MNEEKGAKLNSRGKKVAFAAVCLALCVLLPLAFHSVPAAAILVSPLHIPVLLAALACGWEYGLLLGFLGPALCFLLTGMPAVADLLPMMAECAVYGVIGGLLMKFIRTGNFYADAYLALLPAMMAGRIFGGVLQALFFAKEYSFALWAGTYFVRGWVGILIQLLLIPSLLFSLTKAKILPSRYEEEQNKNNTSPEEGEL